MKNAYLKSIVFGFVALISLVTTSVVYADCEPNYGGGQTCIYNKNFEIEKKVRKEGDDSWKDKVTDVEEGDVIEFRIKIKNTGEIDVDNMKMKDSLPDELYRVGGNGLTEYWDDFEVDETKEFKIKVKIDEDEFDRENFEKCVVNKATVYYDDVYEASDTATVCYGDSDITELPETGASATVGILGISMVALGTLVKKQRLA